MIWVSAAPLWHDTASDLESIPSPYSVFVEDKGEDQKWAIAVCSVVGAVLQQLTNHGAKHCAQAFFAPIPVLCYIYLRNCHVSLRQRHSPVLHLIGKTTLETYLMQHHIWCATYVLALVVAKRLCPYHFLLSKAWHQLGI